MNEERLTLGVAERRFADIIWERAPIGSGDLVKVCAEELNWNKSTTYTVLRRLCQKGLFTNSGTTVRVKLTKEEYNALRSRTFVENTFGGSLPAFFASFLSKADLTEDEANKLRKMIDDYEKSASAEEKK